MTVRPDPFTIPNVAGTTDAPRDAMQIVLAAPAPVPALTAQDLMAIGATGISILIALAVIACRIRDLTDAVREVAAAVRDAVCEYEDGPPDDNDGEMEPQEQPALKLVGRP